MHKDPTARGANDPLRSLCELSERIGHGRFEPLDTPFSAPEMEELRLAMNAMAARLRRSREKEAELLHGAVHELRTPLMSITGYAQGIEQGVFSPPEEAARTILRESNRMATLVNNLLQLTRLEDSFTAPEHGPFDLDEVIADCLDRCMGTAVQKGLTVDLQENKPLATALGSADCCETVLDNLLSNALRYAKERITLSVRCEGERIVLTVADDGPGIDPQILPQIFDRFVKGRGGKFGLGLALAHGAAGRMGGSLTAENAPAGGAVFTLTLRRADAAARQTTGSVP